MRVLILGGTRYFGRSAFEALRDNTQISTIQTLSRSRFSENDDYHTVCDRKNKEQLHSALRKFQPDVIVDMINFARDDSEGMVEAYDMGILSSLKHYIVISSFFVYNYFDEIEFREGPLDLSKINENKVDGYTFRKIEMETVLYASELMNFTSILRLPFVFSADDYSGRFQKICEIAKYGRLQSSDADHRYSMISKSFASKGINYLCFEAPKGIIDFANSGCVTSEEITQIVGRRFRSTNMLENDEILVSPYIVATDICTHTDKISLNENLKTALKTEADKYYSALT